jgi:ribosomal protein S26
VNHYANVNSTFRQSWKKQKAVAVPPPRAATGGASASQVKKSQPLFHLLRMNVKTCFSVECATVFKVIKKTYERFELKRFSNLILIQMKLDN